MTQQLTTLVAVAISLGIILGIISFIKGGFPSLVAFTILFFISLIPSIGDIISLVTAGVIIALGDKRLIWGGVTHIIFIFLSWIWFFMMILYFILH